MAEPMNHEKYTQALCRVIGFLYGLVQNEPQPHDRRTVLERMRVALDDALKEPEAPPEVPASTVDFFVQSSNGDDLWVHCATTFASEAEARYWARGSYHRWNRIQRVETSYILVERPEESCA